MINEQEPKEGFTGIFLTAELLICKELSLSEKLLVKWIEALSKNEHQSCWASNAYLAERLEKNESCIAMAISRLRKKGLIEDVKFDGRLRFIRICQDSLNKMLMQGSQNVKAGLTKCYTSHKEHTYSDSKAYSKDENIIVQTPQKSPTAPEEADASLLALSRQRIDLFLNLMKENWPQTRLSDRSRDMWERELCRMVRIDKVSWEEIDELINWSQADSFYSTIIRSVKNLRKHAAAMSIKLRQYKAKQQSIGAIVDKAEENSRFSFALEKKLKAEGRGGIIDTRMELVRIRIGNKLKEIRFNENGFKDQLTNELRKGGIEL